MYLRSWSQPFPQSLDSGISLLGQKLFRRQIAKARGVTMACLHPTWLSWSRGELEVCVSHPSQTNWLGVSVEACVPVGMTALRGDPEEEQE